MAWDHLSITKPHLVYIILGGFTSLFMLCSSVIKERLYIGEATVATIVGLIFGPHGANLINPQSWGSTDIVTIEFSRIVLVVQCFAVGVELPKFYMERHWRSVIFLLVPVMTFGWLVTSLFVWWMVPVLGWLESLVVAACVTATDPVLASSVVGKGKFAKRVPKHLRDLLSAESGCNDGLSFPFVYLALTLLQYNFNAKQVTFHWIVLTILYECVFGTVFGFLIGYIARHGIKQAEKRELIDRESFLVFYFVLALFCAGSGSILGVDDLLVGFACGVGFSNDGWFTGKTEESHVSNVIDLLLNLTYFVYLGTIIPWEQFNNTDLGLQAWRLSIIAIFVILFRRIPIVMALKPFIPDIKTWREALFAGHFGPIGVGAIFVAILARAELEGESPVPLAEIPLPTSDNKLLILVWPIVTFLVVASILIHGSSVAVFTLGKHINTLTLTMSYTIAQEDGPSWMNRLPRISSISRSQAKTTSDTDYDDLKMPEYPPGTLPPPGGVPSNFLRRVKDEEISSRSGSGASSLVRKRWKRRVEGGPIEQSAIAPQRKTQNEVVSKDAITALNAECRDPSLLLPMHPVQSPRGRARERFSFDGERGDGEGKSSPDSPWSRRTASLPRGPPVGERIELYDEGDHIIVENEAGDVLAVAPPIDERQAESLQTILAEHLGKPRGRDALTFEALKKKFGDWREGETQKRKEKDQTLRRHEPARAYQFGNTIIVENAEGEVVKKYEVPSVEKAEGSQFFNQSLKYMGMGGLAKGGEKSCAGAKPGPPQMGDSSRSASTSKGTSWLGRRTTDLQSNPDRKKKNKLEEEEEEDDRHLRFTIGGEGQRMTKEGLIREMQKLDKTTKKQIVDQLSAPQNIKTMANEDSGARVPKTPAGKAKEKRAVETKSTPQHVASRTAPLDASCLQNEPANGSTTARSSSGDRAGSTPSAHSGGNGSESAPSRFTPETAVERRRRLAALNRPDADDSPDGKDNTETEETPAERRRREAALGIGRSSIGEYQLEEDSEDDDTPRVPPTRRGIRFADAPFRGRD